MARGDLKGVVEHLRRALPGRCAGGLTDGELLGRFVAARDEAAFEALVRRHGPAVLGVCRRVLGDAHDADDAFQAAFLLLVRKAGSVLKRESVGSWLYGVAYRTSLAARTARLRRRARERQVDSMPHPAVFPAEPLDWHVLLDREIARLPERYRAAVVVHYLEGWDQKEAARRLGVPLGTLSSRLVKARLLLARRLARSGLSLSGAALASVLVEGVAPAAVPAPLVATTVRAAALFAAGQVAAVPTSASMLMRGVLHTMLVKKLQLVLGLVVVAVALGMTGVAYRAGGGAVAADEPAAAKPMSEIEALRRENRLLKLNLELALEKVAAFEAGQRGQAGSSPSR